MRMGFGLGCGMAKQLGIPEKEVLKIFKILLRQERT